MNRTILLLALGLSVASSALAQPARVVLLRHAEKPPNDEGIHLSELGQKRAQALMRWATNSPAWDANDRPAAVFACQPTPKAPSLRAIETITPLAGQLQLPVQTPFPAKNPGALAQQILSDSNLKGKTVIVCWGRDELPELATALGVKSGADKWGKNVFNRIWVLTFAGAEVKLSERPQLLLPEDGQSVTAPTE